MQSTNVKGVNIQWLGHATVRIKGRQIIYIDPFKDVLAGGEFLQGDVIIATHPHFDHYDPGTVNRLAMEQSVLVAKSGCDISDIRCEALLMEPGDTQIVDGIQITAVPAYNDHRFRNPGEPFHPEGFGMGVVIDIGGARIYHAGDTDLIDEMDALGVEDIDVAFLPIGGTYTMDAEEAVRAVQAIQPDIVVPIHYNFIDGTEANPLRFKREVEDVTDAAVRILEQQP